VFYVLPLILSAQDTISILAYNILKYSSTDVNKNRYKDIREVIKFAKPDVVMFCEIDNTGAPQFLLDSSLNAAGVGTYSRSAFIDGNDTDNMLYYKPGKVKLKSQKQILTSLRDISQYVVYKHNNQGDTVQVYLHMAHLKAGSTPADETQRNAEVGAFCSNIVTIPATAAVVFAGDLNLKSSAEAAWNTLTSGSTCAHTFFDPINKVGFWNNNMAYTPWHTQSTRTSAFPGCCGAATGGLDDRFDFILINQTIKNGLNRVKYLNDSYVTIGNDGQHFNLSLKDAPTNTSVPANVNNALFNISDHLPVMLKLVLDISPVGITGNVSLRCKPLILNQSRENDLIYFNECDFRGYVNIYDINGKKIFFYKEKINNNEIPIPKSIFPKGLYLIEFYGENEIFYLKYIVAE
jgi:endonuclease/exonuclease/phosphatase family metal-dependent hydrolase